MSYEVYLDNVLLPVTPEKIQMKIKNQNETINLINEGEVNILKQPGLTTVTFDILVPQTQYPFATYPGGFRDATYFTETLKNLKESQKPFYFKVIRTTPKGKKLFNTEPFEVSLEEYTINEDVKEGFDLVINVTLKQYIKYGTKTMTLHNNPNSDTPVAVLSETRETENAPDQKTYMVSPNDTLWNIAKKLLGDGSRYPEIAALNQDKVINPNSISVGQVLTLPA